jgi:phosphoglycolate phosphatase
LIRAAIFDFDGTLTELPLDFHLMKSELEKFILSFVTPEVLEAHRQSYMLEMIGSIEQSLGPRAKDFKNDAFRLLRDMEVAASTGKDVFPYTRDVLQSLKNSHLRIGVMTRNCTDAVRAVFPDLDEYADVLVTRDDIELVKPHPAHPKVILRMLDVSGPECLIIGDHPTDIAAGLASGAFTVGVLSGKIGRGDLAKAGAHFIIDDISKLPDIVRHFPAAQNNTEQVHPATFP